MSAPSSELGGEDRSQDSCPGEAEGLGKGGTDPLQATKGVAVTRAGSVRNDKAFTGGLVCSFGGSREREMGAGPRWGVSWGGVGGGRGWGLACPFLGPSWAMSGLVNLGCTVRLLGVPFF